MQAWADGAPNYGLVFLPLANGTNGIRFHPEEFEVASLRPQLTVVYFVPEPASVVLGSLSLLVLRRRVRRSHHFISQ